MTKITKKILRKLKLELEKERNSIEMELEKFAQKDKKLKGDWNTRFPTFNGGEAGGAALEKAADEIEEYSTLLPIEFALETKLKNIDLALEKIEKDIYGICEKCQEQIEIERLKIYPEARFCLKCEGK